MNRAVEAVLKHGTISAAARALGIPVPTLRTHHDRARQAGKAGPLQPLGHQAIIHPDVAAVCQTYEWAWQRWAATIGMVQARYEGPKAASPDIGTQKIVIASDLHVPFHEPEMIADMLAAEGDADLLIINGDLQDFYSISRFTKYEYLPVEREFAEVQAFLELASQRFPRVLIVEGNHDKPRFEKRLREHLDGEMVKVIEFLSGGNLSPIKAIAKQFPNVRLAEHKVGAHTIGWAALEGDLLVCHAEKFSITPGAALRKIDEWMRDFEQHTSLSGWRVLIQAHTHQLGMFPWGADRMLVEGGCLCKQHGYQLTARIGGRPQRRGYVTLNQTNGRTDINSIRLRWFDAEAAA